MNSSLKLFLKANERIYINGAVIRVDRKVALELLNDVQFLLENHVLQAEDATTPLRQLYFIVQIMVMSPGEKDDTLPAFQVSLEKLTSVISNQNVLSALRRIDKLVHGEKYYDALKTIRGLYGIEAEILGQHPGAEDDLEDEAPLKQAAAG